LFFTYKITLFLIYNSIIIKNKNKIISILEKTIKKGIKKEHFFGRKRDKNYSFYVIIELQRTQRLTTKNAKKIL